MTELIMKMFKSRANFMIKMCLKFKTFLPKVWKIKPTFFSLSSA